MGLESCHTICLEENIQMSRRESWLQSIRLGGIAGG
jgi:hypothetical protein